MKWHGTWEADYLVGDGNSITNVGLWENNAVTNCVQLKTSECLNFQDKFVYFDTAKAVGLLASAGNLIIGLGAGKSFNMNSKKIINLLDPTADQEAATKKYVDDNAGGGLTVVASDPASSTNGAMILNTTDNKVKIWYDDVWQTLHTLSVTLFLCQENGDLLLQENGDKIKT